MVPRNREVRSRPSAKTSRMKKTPDTRKLPSVTAKEVADKMTVEEIEVIYLRWTASQKKAVKKAADMVGLTVTDYLLRCHELIAQKLEERGNC